MSEVLARPWVRRGLQLGLSVLILVLLTHDVDWSGVGQTLAQGSLAWLFVAMLVKTTGLLVHEGRLWLALPRPRPPARNIISLGLAAGVLNLALPARAGDLAAIAFMERECNVPVPVGTAAVGVTSFLEAALFAFFLLATMGLGAATWTSILGDQLSPMLWISAGLGLGCITLFGMAVVGKRLDGSPPSSNTLIELVKRTVVETSAIVRDARYIGIQTAAAGVQVVLVVAAFSLAMPASGAGVSDPLTASAMVLGVASLAAFILPPTMAAGPAAASALVLPLFGADASSVLAYAGTYWLVAHVPAVIMGLPALLARK
jgi:hypothetical protein